MGVDPPPDDVMDQPPRRLTDRVIDAEMWIGIAWVGLVMALVTLAALDLGLAGGLIHGDGELAEARPMAFTTLVLAQPFTSLTARPDPTLAPPRSFPNHPPFGPTGPPGGPRSPRW